MGQLDHYINICGIGRRTGQSDIDHRAARALRRRKEGGVRTFEVIPRRVSSVEDLIGGSFNTLTTKDKQGRVQGQGFWRDGVWHVLMRRPLLSEEQENEATLVPGRIQTVSFSVWNGENKERNGQKGGAFVSVAHRSHRRAVAGWVEKKYAGFVLGRPSPCGVSQRVRLSRQTPCGLAE